MADGKNKPKTPWQNNVNKVLINKIKNSTIGLSALKYTAANLLNAIVPILLLPTLTANLTKEEYGVVSIFQVIVLILLPLTGFNAQSAVEREYFNSRTDFPRYVTNAVIIAIVSACALTLLFTLFSTAISDLLEFPAAILWTIPVYCFFHTVCEVLLSTWRVRDKASSYGLFRVGRTTMEILLSIFLVVSIQRGMYGRIEGMLSSAVGFGIIAMWLLRRERSIGLDIDKTYIKDILRFGAPLIPHTLGGIALIYADRVFISKMLGMAETGSYTVGYQIAMGVYLIQSSFNLAWVPWFYKELGKQEKVTNRRIVKITYLYFLALVCLVIGLTAFSPLIFRIFIDEQYHDSVQFVFWIALAFGFDGMYKMVVNYIFYLKKTYIISMITLFTALLNLSLNYFLITWEGAIGAAKATAICMLLQLLLVWVISHRLYPMPWFAFRKG